MQQRQSCNLEDLIDELISFLPITSAMTFIVQFNTENRRHGGGIAKQKIDVLPVDFVSVRLFVLGAGHEEDVSRFTLGHTRYEPSRPNVSTR